VQALARWLVARPLNSILALAATGLLPALSVFSGVVLVLMLLHKGPRAAVIEASAAAALLAGISLLLEARLDWLFGGMAATWVPAALLALLLLRTRSLTLTVQVAWLGMVAVLLVFFAVVREPQAFWTAGIDAAVQMLAEQGIEQQAEMSAEDTAELAGKLTMFLAIVTYSLSIMGLVLGYKLERALRGTGAPYGRFRDLDFGRVIGLATAVASIAAGLSGWIPVQNIAFVMFAMFWMQGLAIAHWSHGQGFLPTFGLAALYVLLPLLSLIAVVGLAVTGYVDAWIGFRRLKTAR
jgi:hypothetical protein